MILYKNGGYTINRMYPDTDFIGAGDNGYIIPDDSEIANKVITMHPNYKIIEDSDGNVLDVIADSFATVENRKVERIKESKDKLSEWLMNNPMQYSDGNYYSCTEEKQGLLNNTLALYERSIAAGVDYSLKWNSTGCENVPWTYDDLRDLALKIADYVSPKITLQQNIETLIKNSSSTEEIDAINISYE